MKRDGISWLGLSAVYTPAERELMSQLPLAEQTVLHVLKSLTDGQVAEEGGGGSPTRGSLTRESPSSRGSVGTQSNSPPTPKSVYTDPAWRMVCIGPGPGPKNVLAEKYDGFKTVVPYRVWKHKLSKEMKPVYTDPEDIPFGSDVKSAEKVSTTTKHPLGYAVVWTSGQGRWCKTKAGKGRHSVLNTFRIWRKWYERKGWTVYGAQANGCLIAKSKSAELHAITIR